MPNTLSLIRTANGLLSPVVPRVSARIAAHLFTTPRRHAPPVRELISEQQGERLTIAGGPDFEQLSALRFGRGPRILAIHGWEGRATQWGPLAEQLDRAGFELVAIDGPAHGQSPGRHAHPIAFANALLAADRQLGPFAAVIGHSMGVPAVAVALSRGLRAEQAVLIAGPSNVEGVLGRFAAMLGLAPAATRQFETRIQGIVGAPAEQLSIATLGRQLRQPALVIHSKDDREIPFADALDHARHWQNATLHAVNGLGHRRIVRDEGVIEAIVATVAAAQRVRSSARC
ncbi:alpha/beta fold hydrolase [Enhygromyxa salina]|uniref:2-succinyl-6-hydroxy-2, 4-cyclohexadiene-1-carboxylate synthase n=1 Tax=Enhygromyxa salina TaxID=215803 RepID=A0A2S9YIZ3_9BACT|nr:alpha/beta hydrolase [Enhygromyxa salina]PRQ05078.1 2-succinyl-6-hydroxy-2,4-cyclohexadiene-1-carboxylate synthase [Enhygromyxa salina]